MKEELKQWNIYKITSNAPLDSWVKHVKSNPLDSNSPIIQRNLPIKPRETFYVKPIKVLKNDELYLVAHLTTDKKNKAKKYNPPKIDNLIESNLPKDKMPHGKIIPINVRFALKSEFYGGDGKLKSASQGFVPSDKTKIFIDNEISRLMSISKRNLVMSQVMRGDFDTLSKEELKDFISIKQFNSVELNQKFMYDKKIINRWSYKLKGLPLTVVANSSYEKDVNVLMNNIKENITHSAYPDETPLILKNGQEYYNTTTKAILDSKAEYKRLCSNMSKSRNTTNNGSNPSNDNEPCEA